LLIVVPLSVQPELLTLPKLASGSTPLLREGDSVIHSAEPRAAINDDLFVVNVPPHVLFVIVSVQLLPPLYVTAAVMPSPGRTIPERLTGNAWYTSYYA